MTRFDSRRRVSTYTSVWMPTGDETVNPVAGYFGGGYDGASFSVIDKITFADDSKSTLSATLTSARYGPAGMANSGVAGYFGGGNTVGGLSGNQSGIDKITFPADTKSTLSGTLTTAVHYLASMANSGTAGYFAGGNGVATGNGNVSGIDKITFSADTKSTLSATLTSARRSMAGFANSGTAGYVGGGNDGSNISGIDKITFSADTKSTLSANLTSARQYLGGMANSGVAGYFGGGNDSGGNISGIRKITFSADTEAGLSATLTSARQGLAGMANSGTAGYFAGGYDGARVSGIDKITFSADTKSTLSATLTSARSDLAGMADSGIL